MADRLPGSSYFHNIHKREKREHPVFGRPAPGVFSRIKTFFGRFQDRFTSFLDSFKKVRKGDAKQIAAFRGNLRGVAEEVLKSEGMRMVLDRPSEKVRFNHSDYVRAFDLVSHSVVDKHLDVAPGDDEAKKEIFGGVLDSYKALLRDIGDEDRHKELTAYLDTPPEDWDLEQLLALASDVTEFNSGDLTQCKNDGDKMLHAQLLAKLLVNEDPIGFGDDGYNSDEGYQGRIEKAPPEIKYMPFPVGGGGGSPSEASQDSSVRSSLDARRDAEALRKAEAEREKLQKAFRDQAAEQAKKDLQAAAALKAAQDAAKKAREFDPEDLDFDRLNELDLEALKARQAELMAKLREAVTVEDVRPENKVVFDDLKKRFVAVGILIERREAGRAHAEEVHDLQQGHARVFSDMDQKFSEDLTDLQNQFAEESKRLLADISGLEEELRVANENTFPELQPQLDEAQQALVEREAAFDVERAQFENARESWVLERGHLQASSQASLEQVYALSARVESLGLQTRAAENRFSAAEAERVNLQAQLHDMVDRQGLEVAERERDEAQQALEFARRDFQTARAEWERYRNSLLADLQKDKDNLQDIRTQLQNMGREVARLQREKDAADTSVTNAESKFEAQRAEIRRLKDDVDHLQARNVESDSAVESSGQELETLRTQLRAARTSLQAEKDVHEEMALDIIRGKELAQGLERELDSFKDAAEVARRRSMEMFQNLAEELGNRGINIQLGDGAKGDNMILVLQSVEDALYEKIRELGAALSNAQNERDGYKQSLEALSGQMGDPRVLTELRSRNSQLQELVEELQGRLEARSTFGVYNEDAQAVLTPLRDRVGSLQEELRSRDELIEGLRVELEQARASEESAEFGEVISKAVHDVEVDRLRAEISQKDEAIELLAREISQVQSRLDTSQEFEPGEGDSVGDGRQEVSALAQALQDLQATVADLTAQNEELRNLARRFSNGDLDQEAISAALAVFDAENGAEEKTLDLSLFTDDQMESYFIAGSSRAMEGDEGPADRPVE